jgi:hypothetical protein
MGEEIGTSTLASTTLSVFEDLRVLHIAYAIICCCMSAIAWVWGMNVYDGVVCGCQAFWDVMFWLGVISNALWPEGVCSGSAYVMVARFRVNAQKDAPPSSQCQ